jgi:tetratricopeptide (TPR) repeat protein
MKRFFFPLAVTLCLLVVVSQYNTVAAKDKWVSIQTKNFFLLGNGSEKEIRQVGLKLEQFRLVFMRVFPNIRFNTPVPTTVIVFKSDDSYGPFKPNPNIAGYFQPGPDVNYITLTTELRGEQDPFSVIFHEYTHLLVNNTFEKAPLWFNEGLAEYYSTFKMTDDQKVAIGTAIGNHVLLLRDSKILPFKTLFAVDHNSPHYNESKKQGIFYAESWALLHYLLIGKTGMSEQLAKFLTLIDAGVPVDQGFQQAFGMPFEAMEKELRNYVKQDRYNLLNGHFEHKLELDSSAQATPLTEAEAQAYLGDLLLHSYRRDAYTYLEKAVKLDPNLAMAHASLGMAYFREGRVAEARASLERAVSLSSQNYLAHYYYAFTLSRLSPEGQPVTYTPELLAKIREHLQKAIELRPDYPESYNLLAFVSLATGDNLEAAIASLKKILAASPGRHDFALTLGQLYARSGDYKQARQVFEQVTKSNADDHIKQESEMMLKQLQTLEENKAQFEEARKAATANMGAGPTIVSVSSDPSGAPSVPSGSAPGKPPTLATSSANSSAAAPAPAAIPAPTPAADASAYLREVLRTPGEGETQLQATLLRIECEPKSIIFVVQTPTGLLRLRTPTFDDVEITTYDTSVKGEITCGERKPANSVIVDYIPNTDKRIKADGIIKSIEFVPSEFKLKP